MEVAELDGKVRKDLADAPLAVEHYGSNLVPLGLESLSGSLVLGRSFCFHFPPVKVALEMRTAHDE